MFFVAAMKRPIVRLFEMILLQLKKTNIIVRQYASVYVCVKHTLSECVCVCVSTRQWNVSYVLPCRKFFVDWRVCLCCWSRQDHVRWLIFADIVTDYFCLLFASRFYRLRLPGARPRMTIWVLCGNVLRIRTLPFASPFGVQLRKRQRKHIIWLVLSNQVPETTYLLRSPVLTEL